MAVTDLSPGLLLAVLLGAPATLLLMWYGIRVLTASTRTTPSVTGSVSSASIASLERSAFCLVWTAPSSLVFKRGAAIRIQQIATSLGPVDLELSTRYEDGWGDVEHGIVAVTKGSAAPDADRASALVAPVSDLLAALSVSANAWIGDLTVSMKDGQSPFSQPEGVQARELDEAATGEFLNQLGAHPRAADLWKTLNCYRQALAHWTPEKQSLALAKLHEGFLALSECVILFLCESRGMSKSEVAKTYGVRQEDLEARVLETELYHDNKTCFHSARVAWQAALPQPRFAVEEVGCPPENVHLAAAEYLRSAIFRVLELHEPHRSVLLGNPFDEPLGTRSTSADVADLRAHASRSLPKPSLRPFQHGSGA